MALIQLTATPSVLKHSLGDHGRRYPVLNTQTTLIITYGRPLNVVEADEFLEDVEIDVNMAIQVYGPHALLPPNGFDHIDNGFEFSVYSPSELPREDHITRQILRDVVDGVADTVVGERRDREVAFIVEEGPHGVFAGYGHFVAVRTSQQ